MTKLWQAVEFILVTSIVSLLAGIVIFPFAIYRTFQWLNDLRKLKQNQGDKWTS
jgi:hypothetical protein